jgi:hypothetical protein
MNKKNHLVFALFFTFALVILLGVGLARASPIGPTEGTVSNIGTTSDAGYITAGAWGYWVWFWHADPQRIVFTELQFNATRTGNYIGDMNLTYWWDGQSPTTFYSNGSYMYTQVFQLGYSDNVVHAYCKAGSEFTNANGQNVSYETPTVEIDS